jgi:hypothetical protein
MQLPPTTSPNLPELVYLLCGDASGRLKTGAHAGFLFALLAAALLELHARGAIALDDRGWTVLDPAPLGDAALDALLGEVLLASVDTPSDRLLWHRLLQLTGAAAQLREDLPRSLAGRARVAAEPMALRIAIALLEAGLVAEVALDRAQRREAREDLQAHPLGEAAAAAVAAVVLAMAA